MTNKPEEYFSQYMLVDDPEARLENEGSLADNVFVRNFSPKIAEPTNYEILEEIKRLAREIQRLKEHSHNIPFGEPHYAD